jgi:serine/threonine protein kinase
MCELVEYHYLVMEFIEGGSLSHNRWLALDQKDQEKVTLRIAEQIQLLRSVPSEGYYGRIMHQGWEPEFSLFRIRMADMCGPYSTYEDCIMALYATAEARAAVSTMAPDFYPDQLLALTNLKHTLTNCAGHEPTLTHLDLKLENIMVRPIQGAKGKVEDYEVVLIDWACLGWLPAWMEAVTVLQRPIFRSQLDTDAFIWGLSQGIKPFHIGVASFFNSLADSVVYHIQ